MTVGLTTWDALPPPGGPVLFVVNATDGDIALAKTALDALACWAGRDAVHVVARAVWRDWLGMEGISAERALLAQDEQGRDVELAHFLHTSIGFPWIAARQFVAVMGVQPHNLYNEKVQEVFEGQLSLLLGDGRLLAHTLPLPYLYLFDVEALVRRLGRRAAVEAYRARAARIAEALYDVWVSQGSPAPADRHDYGDVLAPLARHLDSRYLGFDEGASWPTELVSPVSVSSVVERLVAAVELIHKRDALVAERNQAVELRDRLLAEGLAERNQAVEQRDRLLAEERERYARTLDARVHRGLGKIKRLLRGE